jgi:pyruvate dehydrogenase E2 component (dihydrolipoamide acetyltransferase)
MSEVRVPDIGDFDEVPVIEILVEVGQEVAEEDPLVTLESDKATMEIPSPSAGTVGEIHVSVGDKVGEGSLLLTLDDGSGGAKKPDVDAEEQADDKPSRDDSGAEDAPSEPGASESAPEGDEPEPVERATQAEESAATDEEETSEGPPAATLTKETAPYASPSVRRLAREKGVDLARIEGTGRKGRITKEDVERGEKPAEAAKPSTSKEADTGLGLAPWPKVDFAKFGEVERVALTRIQKLSGPALARNWVRIPHVTHNDEADITELEAFRKQLNAEQSDVKVTMVALLLKACIASLKAYPQLNASLDGDELVLKRYYHLGFAADTPQGLVVPVIRDVDKKGLLELAGDLTALSKKARDGKLGPADIQGGTFTISSLGGIGGTSFTPIVNAPEVAILGVTRSAMKPVWDGSAFVPRLMVPLSLSYDHRVIDGALAARFMAHLVKVLTDMRRVLL